MKLFENDEFRYLNGKLFCEKVDLEKVTKDFGTPIYVYSRQHFMNRFKEFENAFESVNHRIFFAAKSNFNINVLKLFSDLGAGIDVNSAGEFYRAEKAGVNPRNMILTGVGKTQAEIELGISKGVLFLKAESFEEIELINKTAEKSGAIARVAIRVNPDVDPETHPYISTGLSENKFGINSKDALNAFAEASRMPHISLTGIDMHIGSQIISVEPFVEAVEKLAELYMQLKEKGIRLKHFDIGGGMGVRYNDEILFTTDKLAKSLSPVFNKLDCQIIFEPGRFLTANGGVLLTEVLYTKNNGDKNFVVVDAAMNDLLRPSIYKAFHHVQPISVKGGKSYVADIVGPICESGDFIAKNREIEHVRKSDKLAVMSTGAYGMVMASNYNSRRRPAEILIDGENYFQIRKRESYKQLINNEELIL